MEGNKDTNKPLNEIRIGFRSRVRNIVNYANILLKENTFRSLNLSAIGGAIGSLVNAVEVLKINNPGLYQVNKIGTVSYQTVDQQGEVQNQRLYPKLEVILSLDVPQEKGEGFQEKLSEEERTSLFNLSKERAPREEIAEGEERPRGGFRGARRGERGGYRGERGGFRGGRGAPRGGFRGGRGAPRGGFRGGFEGERGGYRGVSRGGPRGGFRGGFRGERGGPRGAPRGGRAFRGPRINRGRGF
jgi:hypothetical protein